MAELNFNLTPVKSENHLYNRSLKPVPRGGGGNGSRLSTVIQFTRYSFTIRKESIEHSIHDCNEPPKASTSTSARIRVRSPLECVGK